MRAVALALSAAFILLCGAAASAAPPWDDHGHNISRNANQPVPVGDARPHAPTPVGRCVNDPALLRRCTAAYTRCSSHPQRTNICTVNFNRCCMPTASPH
jgi:hypothetical protein